MLPRLQGLFLSLEKGTKGLDAPRQSAGCSKRSIMWQSIRVTLWCCSLVAGDELSCGGKPIMKGEGPSRVWMVQGCCRGGGARPLRQHGEQSDFHSARESALPSRVLLVASASAGCLDNRGFLHKHFDDGSIVSRSRSRIRCSLNIAGDYNYNRRAPLPKSQAHKKKTIKSRVP